MTAESDKEDLLLVWTHNAVQQQKQMMCTRQEAQDETSRIMASDQSIERVEVYKGTKIDPDNIWLTHGRDPSTLAGDMVAGMAGAVAGDLIGGTVVIVGTAVLGPTLLAVGCVAALGALVVSSVRGGNSR